MTLCDEKSCTGCAACLNICPVGAIVFESNAEGFLVPGIISDKCVSCGKCREVCPQITQMSIPAGRAKSIFACWHKNKRTRRQSTSGGVFSALAEEVLSKGGVVYGAAFTGFPRVAHICVDSLLDLKLLQGSKYVQSEIGHMFKKISTDISSGRRVLFSGTPCQVAGLYGFLGKRHEELLATIDLVCHGVPSPKVFADYIKWLELKNKANVVDYHFRNKDIGWYLHSTKICFSNGRNVSENFFKNHFFRGFLRELFLRPSCHQCQYASLKRPADITLSDFWGYKGSRNDRLDKDDDKGVSMVMLNTLNGADLFNLAGDKLVVWERSLEDVMADNPALKEPFKPSLLRDQFWQDYRHLSFSEIVEKYMYPDPLTKWWLERYTYRGRLSSFVRHFIMRCKSSFRNILGERLFLGLKRLVRK